MSDTKISLWDGHGQLRCVIDGLVDVEATESGEHSFTLPSDSPAAQWLRSDDVTPLVMVAIDRGESRWTGLMQSWALQRVGPCPECAHCRTKVLKVTCYDPPQRYILGA